jgi:phenylacetate-CoA ligase
MTRTSCPLSVIAPCLNEEFNVVALAKRTLSVLDGLGIAGELILVDDGSSDRTWQAIERLGLQDARVGGVRHRRNLGIAPAWRSGLQAAGGELVCLIDADLQNRPEDIPRLYRAFEEGGADVIQGVRRPVQTLHRHRLFTRGLNSLLNMMFATSLSDNKSGFLLCPREVLEDILGHRFQYRYFQALVGAAAAARGFVIREIDTTFEPRQTGQSFLPRFPIAASLRIVWELIKFRAETCWGAAPGSRLERAPLVDMS